MRILLIEDDPNMSESIQLMLKAEDYIVDATDLGEEGLELGKIYEHDLIILDLMLPDMDGYRVLKRLRDARITTPVLILSGLAEVDSKLKALGIGADDYLTKPFDRRELIARIGALVRRARGLADPVVTVGRMAIDLKGRCVTAGEQLIPLSKREFSILELLTLRKGRVVSKETILDHLYGGMDEPDMKIVDVFVCKLRAKIAKACGGQHYIGTSWGAGYKLEQPAESRAPARAEETPAQSEKTPTGVEG
jgi:two-component system cell cycle response regulator CtrA